MSGRKISPRLRFEVFKRDGFTCRYCGSKSPEVVLEVDHIVPVAEGGSDDEMNLATSCWECNRGKGSVPLDEVMTGEDPHDKAILELERLRQLQEYDEFLKKRREFRDSSLGDLTKHWLEHIPWKTELSPADQGWMRNRLRDTPPEKIREAMDIAIANGKTRSLAYVNSILKRWHEEGSI